MANLRGAFGGAERKGYWLALIAAITVMGFAACQRSDTETATPPQINGVSTVQSYPAPLLTVEIASQNATPISREAYPGVAVNTPRPTNGPSINPTPGPTDSGPESLVLTRLFLPMLQNGGLLPGEPTPIPTITPTPTPTPTPTIDFQAVRDQLQAQGEDLGFSKIGLHVGVGGNRNGLGEWMRQLDAAGVPFFLKSADDAGPIYEAQEIVRESDIPHTLVYRRSGQEYDTPNYDLPAVEAAQAHWDLHKAAFPPELDPEIVWLETMNEVDKERSEWLATFSLETARLAMADGYRWAAFGWSSGEPEVADWETPVMLEFLQLAADNPDQLAIALHEYSYKVDEIEHEYPFKVGRFQQFIDVVDRHGIPRPTILITEWGWEYQDVPSIDEALTDIDWAASMYAPYPEVKGAAIWYLGGGFGKIADDAQRLMDPLLNYNMGNYFIIPLPPEQAPVDPDSHRP